MHSTFCSEMYCASHGRDSPAGGSTELFAMSVDRFKHARKSSVCRFFLVFYRFLFLRFFICTLFLHFIQSHFIHLFVDPFDFFVSFSFPFPLPSSFSLQIPCFSPRLLGNDSTGSSSRNPLRDDKQRRPRIFLSFYLFHSPLSLPRSEFSHYRLKMTE